MKITEATPLIDVARAVCTVLEEIGVLAVLTGGSAATYYAPHAYQSNDADFVVIRFGAPSQDTVTESFAALGYRLQRDHYQHEVSPYPIEFPPGPLAVGSQLLVSWRSDRNADGILHVLHPTDSCKDRLAAYLHWNDRTGLAQAIAVARAAQDDIDFVDLEAWADTEGMPERYREFCERLRE